MVTPTDAWSLGLNPYGSKTLAPMALKFIEYVTLKTQGALLQEGNSADFGAVGPGNPTANLAILHSFYYKWFPPALDNLIKYELANTGYHRGRTLGYAQFETTMDSAFLSIADGVNPSTVLANAQSQLKNALSLIKAPSS